MARLPRLRRAVDAIRGVSRVRARRAEDQPPSAVRQLSREELPARAPMNPDAVYRGKGWKSWPALFGTNRRSNASKNRGKSIVERFPELVAEWHPTKNDGVQPHSLVAGSSYVAWWRCRNGHEWQAAVRTRTAGSKCVECAAENSIASKFPDLVKEWHPDNEVRPHDVKPGSNRKFKWRCLTNPEHDWLMTPLARTAQRQGCPFDDHRFWPSPSRHRLAGSRRAPATPRNDPRVLLDVCEREAEHARVPHRLGPAKRSRRASPSSSESCSDRRVGRLATFSMAWLPRLAVAPLPDVRRVHRDR